MTAARMTDFVLETSLTTGVGTLTLEGSVTGYTSFINAFATGSTVIFVTRNRAGTKFECAYGTITDGSPKDTLTRNLIRSSTGALIDWQAADVAPDPLYVYTYPLSEVLDSLLQNNRGTTRPAWLPNWGSWVGDGSGVTARALYLYVDGYDVLVGYINETAGTFTPAVAGPVNELKGADIASAGSIDIGAATGNLVHITGTTTITALGTIAAGAGRVMVFDGILTFTHNATSLILPGGANITTAAGDIAVMRSEGSGNWRCVAYQRADGRPLTQRRGADIASAATTVLDNATGDIVDMTGTATVTAITLADGREQTIRATGAFTLTHGASLVLPGSANIVAAAGDVATFRGYAAGVVRCTHYQKANGRPLVGGIGAWSESYVTTTPATIATAIPDDDTLPQIGEGTEVANVASVVVETGQKVEIDWQLHASAVSNATSPVAAIFRSGNNDALEAAFISLYNTNTLQFMGKGLYVDAPSAGTYTYSLRAGPLGSGTIAVNGFNGTTTRKLGGALRSGLRVRVLP